MNNNLKVFNFDKTKDKIKLIAPASKGVDYNKELETIKNFFRKESYILQVSENICSDNCMPYYSNDRNFRLKDFKEGLLDDEVKVLWCYRGGYGSFELLEHILNDKELLKNIHYKVLVGFSDITALNLLLNQNFNWPTLHAGITFNSSEKDYTKEFYRIFELIEQKKDMEIPISKMEGASFKVNGIIKGKIWGGNLKLIVSSLGTFMHPNIKDSILLLEEINEKAYVIARDLHHLKYAGILNSVKAVILGSMNYTNPDKETQEKEEELIDKTLVWFFNENKIPYFRAKQIGHVNKAPIFLGTEAIIKDDNIFIINPLN